MMKIIYFKMFYGKNDVIWVFRYFGKKKLQYWFAFFLGLNSQGREANLSKQPARKKGREQTEKRMKFAVKAWSNGGKARSGVLQLGSCPHNIETPALLLTTRKGLPVYIPPDHLPSLPSPDSNLLHFSPLHL